MGMVWVSYALVGWDGRRKAREGKKGLYTQKR